MESQVQDILKNLNQKLYSQLQGQALIEANAAVIILKTQLEDMAQYALHLEIENEKLKNPAEVTVEEG